MLLCQVNVIFFIFQIVTFQNVVLSKSNSELKVTKLNVTDLSFPSEYFQESTTFNNEFETKSLLERTKSEYIYKVAAKFSLYYSPVVFCTGLIGNTISFLVMMQVNIKQN